MEWAHQRGYSRFWNTHVTYGERRRINVQTYESAAKNGQLGALQWLRQNGCVWDKYTCSAAARGGHLSVLPWVRANNGCPWNDDICSRAAKCGYLSVLQWARESCSNSRTLKSSIVLSPVHFLSTAAAVVVVKLNHYSLDIIGDMMGTNIVFSLVSQLAFMIRNLLDSHFVSRVYRIMCASIREYDVLQIHKATR